MDFQYNVPVYLDLASADQFQSDYLDEYFAITDSFTPQKMSASADDLSAPGEASPHGEPVCTVGQVCEAVKDLEITPHKKQRKHGNSENQENKAPTRDKKGARRRSRSFAMGCPLGESNKNRVNRDKYISLAEAIQHFHKDTPVRFRMKPSKAPNENKSGGNMKLQYTIAKSPVLKSQLRIRPVNYLPHEVQEELEMQEIRRHKFKAQPLNTVMLKQQQSLKVVAPKPVTKPVPFALTQVKASKKVLTEEQAYHFKANPIPKSVYLSPNSTLADTSNGSRTSDTSQSDKTLSAASAVSVYERSMLMQQRRQDKILQVFEEERKAREFHANPIPKSVKNAPAPLLHRSAEASVSHTKPEPFKLYTEQRMVEHEKKRLEELEKQRLAEARAMNFKAHPATVLHREPFVPKKPEHHSHELPEVVLNTEVRAKKREEFDKLLREKELMVERYKADRLEKQREEEERERARLRKDAEFRAQPVRAAPPPLLVKPSDKAPTVPQSPCITKRKRMRSAPHTTR